MKNKILVLILAISFASTSYSASRKFSKWSISVEYGVDQFFFGDLAPTSSGFIPKSLQDVTYGGTLEYALTPIWGLSVDYYHLPFTGTNQIAYFKTNLDNTDLSATINFTKMIFPQSKSKFTVNGTIGMGFAIFNSKFRYPDPVNTPEATLIKPVVTSAMPITLLLEYNFSQQFAFGVKGHYRAFTNDNLEGVPYLNFKGVTNDYIGIVSLAMRYKINASGRKKHLRNITMEEFDPNKAMDLAKQAMDKVNGLDKSLKKLEKRVDAHDRRLDSLSLFLSNDGPDSDGDGVPDHRDKDSSTPANTPVDFWGKALPISYASQDVNRNTSPSDRFSNENDVNNTTGKSNVGSSKNKKGKNSVADNYLPADYGSNSISFDNVPTVYFAFDRTDLDDDALEDISKIAFKMHADPTLIVEVRGYCDYLGNNPYNNQLSQRRSDRVKAELVKMWKISPDRIIANGKGKIIEPRVRYRPNRRCDFFFSN
jgi:outer membrane protein OmpA-like peptidoglycan-associated protein